MVVYIDNDNDGLVMQTDLINYYREGVWRILDDVKLHKAMSHSRAFVLYEIEDGMNHILVIGRCFDNMTNCHPMKQQFNCDYNYCSNGYISNVVENEHIKYDINPIYSDL